MIYIGIQHNKKCDTQNSDTQHYNKRDATENKRHPGSQKCNNQHFDTQNKNTQHNNKNWTHFK